MGDNIDKLSDTICKYFTRQRQSETQLIRKLTLRDLLFACICPVFPMCGLYIVGSSLNGFGGNSSDMDLCLMITDIEIDQRTDAVIVLRMIIDALDAFDLIKCRQLIFAKTPILRLNFKEPYADITVDLNANNSVSIRNTHLLRYYATCVDMRVCPLVTVIKDWAKRRGINDASRSSFSSYSLVLMTIHYLQCGVKPPVLPSLQKLYRKLFDDRADVRSLSSAVPLSPTIGIEFKCENNSSLGELLIGFFKFYAFDFDFDNEAISVRLGESCSRTQFVRRCFRQTHSNLRQWHYLFIEEPFTLTNTAHSIYDGRIFSIIKQAFVDAYVELEKSRDLNVLLNATPISIFGGGSTTTSSTSSE